jgi:4-amino-4-deoxy-L-arabinose transferase-like glycosyltransferase
MKLAIKRPLSLPRLRSGVAWLIALTGVVAVGAYLRFHALGDGGLGNPFYAATVRSMTGSLHNAFFVAFDPPGTFMADKPPLALWLQTLSALVFGYGGFALMLPQAIAGTAAAALLYAALRRTHDDFAALTAAAVLAVLPASVLVSRNNTMDTIVMALSLGSAVLALKAAASGRILPLLAAAALAGLAFNTKGFEAFVAMPGVGLAYLVASDIALRRRIAHLALFAAVTAVVGLSWVSAVSLFPAEDRPIVLNSDGDDIWNLTFGYNGFDRVLGGDGFNPANALTTNAENVIPLGVLYGGETGPLRIFGEFPGPLIAAAVPAAAAGALVLLFDIRDRSRRAAAALWIPWLAAGLVAFSASRLGSPHYLEAFSPAVAACAGVAAGAALSETRWRRLVAQAGIALSGAYGLERLTHLGDAGGLIEALAVAAIATAAAGWLLSLVLPRWRLPALSFAPFACVLGLLFAMSYQAVHDAPVEGVQPGVVLLTEDRSRAVRYDPSAYAYSFITGNYDYLERPLAYLKQRGEHGGHVAGVRSFYLAAAIISQHDLPVLPLYSEFRNRPELPTAELQRLMDQGAIEYFMVSLPFLRAVAPESAALVESRCTENVSRAAGLAPQTGMQLLHCRPGDAP